MILVIFHVVSQWYIWMWVQSIYLECSKTISTEWRKLVLSATKANYSNSNDSLFKNGEVQIITALISIHAESFQFLFIDFWVPDETKGNTTHLWMCIIIWFMLFRFSLYTFVLLIHVDEMLTKSWLSFFIYCIMRVSWVHYNNFKFMAWGQCWLVLWVIYENREQQKGQSWFLSSACLMIIWK